LRFGQPGFGLQRLRAAEHDLAEIDRHDEGLVERLAVGGAREDPVLGNDAATLLEVLA
jgi:hypothetical protein